MESRSVEVGQGKLGIKADFSGTAFDCLDADAQQTKLRTTLERGGGFDPTVKGKVRS